MAPPQPKPQNFPKRTQVAVIGGGIAGVATAYFLAKAGIPVVVLEKGRIAGEQSSRNWGWIRKQGRDPLELPTAIESLRLWAGLEKEIGEDLGWRQGGLGYLARSDADMARNEEWLDLAKPYQLDTRLLSAREADRQFGLSGERYKGALFTPSDGRAEPTKAVPALARAAERQGALVFQNCAVRTVETANGAVTGVVTEHGEIACEQVLCAAGAWSALFSRNLGIDLPQLAVRSSVMRTTAVDMPLDSGLWAGTFAIRPRQDGGYTIARGGAGRFDIVPDALRHFRRFLPGLRMSWGDIQIRFGGEFFRQLVRAKRWTGTDETVFERVRVLNPAPDETTLDKAYASAKEVFPRLGETRTANRWAGMIDVTPDALPVICALDRPKGYYIATGFSGHGFGFGPGAGLVMSELIATGKPRVDLTPFRFERFFGGSPLRPFAPF